MAAGEIHVNDIGTVFLATVKNQDGAIQNLATATTLEMIFLKPGGEKVTKTPAFYTDGTDGKIFYSSIIGDLNKGGVWKVQVKVAIPGDDGGEWFTDIYTFDVVPNL